MNTNQIKRIEVKNLFNQYQLNWELNQDVNILIGINGSGKSTILGGIDSLLSGKSIPNINCEIKITFFDGSSLQCKPGIKEKNLPIINHTFIATFDVPLKNKKGLKQMESPLDKELRELLYTVGTSEVSFSNYRFKATNFPKQAKKINENIKNLFNLIDNTFGETKKKINIDLESNEIYFKRGNWNISLEQLSSGEKQLLIVLFSVFLMEQEPYILLLDEPEISLHVGWQQQLIDNIRTLNPNCQLIISTHSPSIFGKGWGDKLSFIEDLYL